MASYQKRGKSWRAIVRRNGITQSSSFRTKAEAHAWAVEIESGIISDSRGYIPDKPFSELLERYRDEVSITKRGERWERLRIGLICRDPLALVRLPKLSATDFAEWRDRRLRSVSGATVRREWNLLSHAINIAVKEWKWLTENHMKEVRRPQTPKSRDRLPTEDEIERLLFALGYEYDKPPDTKMARVGAAMLLAIETAMRAGEICGLGKDKLNLEGRYASLPLTKNGTARNVPLSTEALRIVKQLSTESDLVFGLSTQQIDALFRKAKSLAMIEDLHFHDFRHEAITRLSKKLDVLDLARMVGIRDLKILMIYYNATATAIAARLG